MKWVTWTWVACLVSYSKSSPHTLSAINHFHSQGSAVCWVRENGGRFGCCSALEQCNTHPDFINSARELTTSIKANQSQETKPISPKSFSSMTLKGFRDMICEYVIRVLQFFKTNLLGTGMITIQFHQQQGHFQLLYNLSREDQCNL